MNNRWGRPVESKGSLRSSGQNNINININFNAVKDKPNAFAGKKIDNFIQISNQSKPNVSRPNVSMETLKQKKKKISVKQQYVLQPDLQRKRSKSKIINDVQTPQKITKERQSGNSRSIGKKSTKKRSAKSYDNLKKFYGKSSPLSNSRHQEVEQSRDNSKQNSREKSKQRSKSNKKLTKNSSKGKIATNSTNTRTKNSNHNSKKQNDQQKQKQRICNLKVKKVVPKKIEKTKIDESPNNNQILNKKPSMQRIPRKKSSQDESKKVIRTKTPKKKSKQKQSKSLKRLPLFYEDEDEVFDEEGSYKKIKKQAQRILYEQEESREQKSSKENKQNREFKKGRKQQSEVVDCSERQTPYVRYLLKTHTYEDIKFLTACAIIIQKHWKGYKARTQFINELNMMNHKIQITKNKIANLDPKFWDDAQSNSILKADDAMSVKSEEALSQLNSQMEKSISEHSSTNRNKMRKNRVIEYSEDHNQMIERITKLEQILKKEQAKAQQLEEQNKQLKINLQKVSVNSAMQSGGQSMEQSLKSDQSWEVRFNKNEDDPFMEQSQESNKDQNKIFSIRMPVKKQVPAEKQQKSKQQEKKQTEKKAKQIIIEKESDSVSEESNSDKIKKMRNKIEKFQCSSPKFAPKININSSLLQLFQKKEDQLKENYEKKANIYDRMLNDSIFSPRTYSLKKNELQQRFKQEAESIRNKKQEVARVAQYIQEIEAEQPKLLEKNEKPKQPAIDNKPSSIICQSNHVIEDYGNTNLNSHRSRSESQEADQFESSIESEKSSNNIFKRTEKKNQSIANEIESKNGDAIRIFQEVSEQDKKSIESSEQNKNKMVSQIQNSSQVSEVKPRGLQTALLFIRQYCLSFIQFIRNSEEHRNTFIQGICSPITYDYLQLLKSYRTTTANQNDSSYNTHEKQYIYPFFKLIYPKSQTISRDAFNQFNNVYEKLQGQCFYPAERQFFLNSLLDAFNQSLDYKRPSSIYGQPPPWISEHRALKNFSLTKEQINDKDNFIASERFDEICGVSIARVMQWSASLCGFIPESPQMENVVIEEQQINHIRETRIALMLEKDLLQNEESMLDSIIEQTEVKLSLGQAIVNELVLQVVEQLTLFFK